MPYFRGKNLAIAVRRNMQIHLPGLVILLAVSMSSLLRAEESLVIAAERKTTATVVVSPAASEWEKKAAEDLAKYIEQMTGAKPALANTAETAAAALKTDQPLFIVGQAALAADATLAPALAKVAKPNPLLRADAIVLRRAKNRVYLAGTNDDSHYYAVAELLRRWGCRWYLPGEIGECIPKVEKLTLGDVDYAYGSPFEIRRYWISWNGETAGKPEFMHRNFFNEVSVPNGHALGQYTKELIPPGKTMFNVPISEDRTAEHVAKQVLARYARGEHVMLGMEDGLYESDSAEDKKLVGLEYDKYFLTPSYTDAFLVFYNKTAAILDKAAPDSKAKIGFLAYANITLPPVRDIKAARPLVAYLAPIDIDPIHGMDDPRSGPKRELAGMVAKWAKVMEGRLAIYDYDQGMLVWRDLPNPSHMAFRQDVKHYLKAGILGVDTESRGAMATIFTNLYFRGRLLWNPDADITPEFREICDKLYGPAAGPMEEYWNLIFQAWEQTICTEHEYFVAPAIYTPELVEKLGTKLAQAEAALKSIVDDKSPRADQFRARIKLARLGFDVLDAYMTMVRAAGTDVDYAAAVKAGERGLAAREKLTETDGTFTTYKRIGEHGYAWWPGEVQQYRELLPLVDGTKGTLVAKLPLTWNFRRDEKNIGEKEEWFKKPVDLAWWSKLTKPVSLADRQNNPGEWEQVQCDLYLQAQGLVTKDFQSWTGHGWYQTDLDLTAEQAAGKVHLKFPGLFNACWLYVNGQPVATREFKGVWWMNDYRFEWDVDLAGKLAAGKNTLLLRLHNPHHMGGMFRRPFLYRAK